MVGLTGQDGNSKTESTGEVYSDRIGQPSTADDNLEEGEPPAFVGDVVSKATFETYEDARGKYRLRLVDDNGNIVADKRGGYASRAGVEDGVHSVKYNAPNAPVESVDSSCDSGRH